MHTSAPEPSSSTAASDSPRSARLIGAALLLLGIAHGLAPMVFTTGLGFALAGAALLARAALARALLGAAMLVGFGLFLANDVCDTSLGIDLVPFHLCFDDGDARPSRMAPAAALGFMLIGALHLRLARIDSRRAACTAMILSFCLLTVGLTGLAGSLVEPDRLSGWSESARMALPTASGMLLAAFGSWIGWSRSAWFTGARFFSEAAKLRWVSTAILFVVTTASALSGVALAGLPLNLVILLISALGAWALYSQTAPLVARMRASERQAEQAAAETRSLMQAVGEGIMTIDGRGTIRSINPAAYRIFCYREEELYGQPVSQLVPERLRAAHEQGLSRAAAGGPPRLIGGPPVTVEGLRKDGSQFPLELTLTSVTVGNERRFVGVVRDITERQAMERQLEHMAQYDSLTGLANRRLFMERLRIALARGKRHGDAVAVLFIDLDGFKQVNDTLGHAAGDALLVEVARRMTSAVRATDTVARLGGDEFTLILEDMQAPAHQAKVVAHKLLEHLWRPFQLAEGTIGIGASIGLMVHDCTAGPGDVDEILRAADARMYAAKVAGKNRVVSA